MRTIIHKTLCRFVADVCLLCARRAVGRRGVLRRCRHLARVAA